MVKVLVGALVAGIVVYLVGLIDDVAKAILLVPRKFHAGFTLADQSAVAETEVPQLPERLHVPGVVKAI